MRNTWLHVISIIAVLVLAGSLKLHAAPLDHPGAPKAMVCSACHGAGGNSPGNSVPIIAGMSPVYFKKVITDYAEGRRASPEMEPFAKYVMQAGLDDIAAYFAQEKRLPPQVKVDPNAAKRGAAVANQCIVCHNPKGEGDPEAGFPVLLGQNPGYVQHQLRLLRDDKRKIDDPTLNDLKNKLLKRLSDKEIADLAAYFASVR